MKTIIDAIKAANKSFDMHIRLLMEPFDLPQQGLSGKEDYILLDEDVYKRQVPDNYYSFTLPITTPATKYFCRNGYTRRIGTVHNKIKAPLIPLPVTSIR